VTEGPTFLPVAQSPDSPAPARPGVARKTPARKRREPITTLEEFFGRRAAKAATFLKDLREAERWEFAGEDVETVLQIHAERDKDFAKTVQLIAAAMKERDGRFAGPAVAFGELAVRRRLADNPHAVGVDFDATNAAADTLDLMARVLGARLREGKRRAESTNLLLATVLCLNHREGLDAETATEKLLAALAIEPTRSSDRQRTRLIWLGERPKELRAVLELLAPSVRSANERGELARRRAADLGVERDARLVAEQETVRLSGLLADLQETVTAAKAEIRELEESSRAAGIHADHDVKRVKARIAGVLDGQLRDLIMTIDEALSVDPPRVDVAREKAEVVVRELERQAAWLRS
jgi:hypothetical protein